MMKTGAEALAEGLMWMGVTEVTGYPGSPATGIMEHYKKLAGELSDFQGRWMINEKVSFEYAVGSSLVGCRAATVLKNVGFNLVMDSLVITALTGVKAACLILLGDDPGARQSSHEEDARPLAVSAEVPLLEPAAPHRSPEVLRRAVEISEKYEVPVVIRFTPTFIDWQEDVTFPEPPLLAQSVDESSGTVPRLTCVPHEAVSLHARLHKIMDNLSREAALSHWEGSGSPGIIAVGDSWLKVRRVLGEMGADSMRVMRLEEVNPLPVKSVLAFLAGVRDVFVVEETLPLVEEKVAAFCHQHRMDVRVWGKLTGHLPREDVLSVRDICIAISELARRGINGDILSRLREDKVGWGEGTPVCEGCPYGTVLEALRQYWRERGLPPPVLAGEPGCSARLSYPPHHKLDLFLCMGSSSPLISAVAERRPDDGRPVAVIGDSAFLNSGIPALVEACRLGARILVIIVNNYSAALTGFQPTLELKQRQTVKTLAAIIKGARPAFFASVLEHELDRLLEVIRSAHSAKGPAVLLINAACPSSS